jgi:hypothetical protein
MWLWVLIGALCRLRGFLLSGRWCLAVPVLAASLVVSEESMRWHKAEGKMGHIPA